MKIGQLWLSALASAICLTGVGVAQNAGSQTTSLGDLAKQQRARSLKALEGHPVRTWTNDNMPKRPASEGVAATTGMSPTPPPPTAEGGTGTTPPPGAETAASGESGNIPEPHDEKYYRKRMSSLQARLETHQRELAVLQQKVSQGQMQYYSDPNKTLLQEYSRSDINKLNDQVTKAQEAIAADEKAVQDLRDQLRREGHPPGWLR